MPLRCCKFRQNLVNLRSYWFTKVDVNCPILKPYYSPLPPQGIIFTTCTLKITRLPNLACTPSHRQPLLSTFSPPSGWPTTSKPSPNVSSNSECNGPGMAHSIAIDRVNFVTFTQISGINCLKIENNLIDFVKIIGIIILVFILVKAL